MVKIRISYKLNASINSIDYLSNLFCQGQVKWSKYRDTVVKTHRKLQSVKIVVHFKLPLTGLDQITRIAIEVAFIVDLLCQIKAPGKIPGAFTLLTYSVLTCSLTPVTCYL